jgi:hypothetical protein
MIIRILLFSVLVAGFALLVRVIVARTRHLEKRQLEAGLLGVEVEHRTMFGARQGARRVAH